jgi:hypothetical protein
VQGLGTAFVRLDPITLLFSEPISPWRIRSQNVSIQNINLSGETFDLFMFFTQDRDEVKLQITVFDADSTFDQASVPQGRYKLTLTQFTDLAGNALVSSPSDAQVPCEATGTFTLTFSTVSSPTLPTDFTMTFGDDDGNGHVDYGGLSTGSHNSNALPGFVAPFLGGIATDYVTPITPSNQTTSANWGDTAFWTGAEMRYDNGFDPNDPARTVPPAVRLRGGTNTAATPILCPLAGRATGPSDPNGSVSGMLPSPGETGKVDFFVQGAATVELFTGDATTGPITYHYNRFDLLQETAVDPGEKPLLRARTANVNDSLYPLVIFVEDDAVITGSINVDGRDGEHGFNYPQDFSGSGYGRNPGGLGGLHGPGGGPGGNGGCAVLDTDVNLIDGQNGGVPYNVIGPLSQLSEAIAGLNGMSTGGGGLFNELTPKVDANSDGVVDAIPSFQGGGGGGTGGPGTNGGDSVNTTPGVTNHGKGGLQVGTHTFGFFETGILASGGAGGGGGGGDDDGGGTGSVNGLLQNGIPDIVDDGGGGGGGGGGFFGFACRGNVTLGTIDTKGTAEVTDDVIRAAFIRACGGRGGSTYQDVDLMTSPPPPPVPTSPSAARGQGSAGGGGGGGGIAIVAGGSLTFTAAQIYAYGKLGGNHPSIEGGTRVTQDSGGAGGGGKLYFADGDGVDSGEYLINPRVIVDRVLAAAQPGLSAEELEDFNEMSGVVAILSGRYGDSAREPMFGPTQIVTEFFDTLSDLTSYDGALILWNAPRYSYSPGTATMRTMRIFIDTCISGVTGLPLTSPYDEDRNPATAPIDVPLHELVPGGPFLEDSSGNLSGDQRIGFSQEIPEIDALGPPASYQMQLVLQAGLPSLHKRYVRARIIFDPTLISTDPNVLLGPAPLGFAPAGGQLLPIADDPNTPGLENTRGNLDTAPEGVPAVAELRITFTP